MFIPRNVVLILILKSNLFESITKMLVSSTKSCLLVIGIIITIIVVVIIIIIIIIIIIEFFTSQLRFGNIHPSWDVVINRIRLGGLTCSLKSFLQLNMCQELQIFAVVYIYLGASKVLLDFVIVTLELLP